MSSRDHACADTLAFIWSPVRVIALQGGKEAARSNEILHKIIVQTIAKVAPDVGPELIGLVTSRQGVDDLLNLDDVIDLVSRSFSIPCTQFARPNAPTDAHVLLKKQPTTLGFCTLTRTCHVS